MKKTLASLILTPLLLTGCFQTQTLSEEDKALPTEVTPFNQSSIEIDYDNSYFAFTGKKGTTKNHQCEFEDYSVEITLDDTEPQDLEKAQVSVTVELLSMKTDSDTLTGHLLGEKFFNAIDNPTATFSSESITNTGDNQYEVEGTLSIKGVDQQITLDAEITNEYAHITHDLNRTPFQVGDEAVADALVPLDIKLMFQ